MPRPLNARTSRRGITPFTNRGIRSKPGRLSGEMVAAVLMIEHGHQQESPPQKGETLL